MALDIEKDFLSNVDYLKSLVKELKSKPTSEFDSNLIYEVTYADMYVTDLLTKVKEPKLAETVNDIKTALDLIIKDIPEDGVEDAKRKSDYTKILKAKYKNIDDGSFEEKVAYEGIEESSILKEYLIQRLPTIITVSLLFCFVAFGFENIKDFVGGIIDFIDGFFGIASSTSEQVMSSEAEAAMQLMQSCVNSMLAMVIFLLFAVLTVTLTIDIIYISLPFLRDILDNGKEESKWVSIYAKSAIENVDGNLIKYKKIKSFDRIKRNQYWLQSMIDTISSLQQSGKEIDINFAKSLIDLQCKIKACTERSREWYNLIAKIEFMHDNYLKSIDGVAYED